MIRRLLSYIVPLAFGFVISAGTTALAQGAPNTINQSDVTKCHVQWTVAAPDAATAQRYTYRLYVDGAAGVVTQPTAITANAAGGFQVEFALPSNTLGTHVLTETQQDGTSDESIQSDPFTYTVVADRPPTPPQGKNPILIRILVAIAHAVASAFKWLVGAHA